MGELVGQQELEDRVSKEVVKQVLDDDNDGTADGDPVRSLIGAVEGHILSTLETQYDTDAIVDAMTVADASKKLMRTRLMLKGLALDFCEGRIYRRHPEYGRQDGQEQINSAQKILDKLIKTDQTLPGISPQAANLGAEVFPDDETLEVPKKFFDNTGIF